MEVLLHHYAYGKPPDKLIVDEHRAPFAVLLRKEVRIIETARTEAPPAEAPPPEQPVLPAATPEPPRPVRRARKVPGPAPEPQDNGGGGVIWGD